MNILFMCQVLDIDGHGMHCFGKSSTGIRSQLLLFQFAVCKGCLFVFRRIWHIIYTDLVCVWLRVSVNRY